METSNILRSNIVEVPEQVNIEFGRDIVVVNAEFREKLKF